MKSLTYYSKLVLTSFVMIIILFIIHTTVEASTTCLTGNDTYVPLIYNGHADQIMPGFYLPLFNSSNESTWPIACTPDLQCGLQRSLASTCDDIQSPFEPQLCPTGYYCPTPNQKLVCPEGYYCLDGTFQPTKCASTSACPAGSERPTNFGGLVLLHVFVVFVLIAIVAYKYRSFQTPMEKIAMASTAQKRRILNRYIKRARQETAAGMDSITFEFSNIKVAAHIPGKDDFQILRGVGGSCRPGRANVFLGPSGSGKTMLFKTLLRKLEPEVYTVEGENKINGSTSVEDYEKIRNAIAFVPQEDILHTELTVYDNVYYSSELSSPRNWTAEEREEFREVIFSLLDLNLVRNMVVGGAGTGDRGISASQRKLTAIACQLVTAPSAIFLDEPTSLLDTTSALKIVRTLKEIAVSAKITCVLVVHQPRIEIFRALDHLLILAPGGRTVYEGKASNVLTALGEFLHIRPQDNPADILLDAVFVNGDEMVRKWEEHQQQQQQQSLVQKGEEEEEETSEGEEEMFLSSQENSPNKSQTFHPLKNSMDHQQQLEKDEEKEIKNKQQRPESPMTDNDIVANSTVRQSHPLRQFYFMHIRHLQKQLATYQYLLLEWLILLITGLILGSATIQFSSKATFRGEYQRISPQYLKTFLPQMLCYTHMSIGLAGAVSGVRVFGEEKIRFRREADAGLNVTSYFFASYLGMIYRCVVSGGVFAGILHSIGSWPTDYWTCFINIVLSYACSNIIGCIISLATTQEYASVIAATVSLLLGVLNGFINFPYWLKTLSYTFWSSQNFYNDWYLPITTIMSPPFSEWGYDSNSTTAEGLAVILGMFLVYSIVVWALVMFLNRQK